MSIRGKKHYIYEPAEATLEDIEYIKDWREGHEGEWVLTDDGFVLQLLRKGKMGRTQYVRTVVGTYPLTKKTRLTIDEREDRYTLWGGRRRPRHLTKRLRLFCKLFPKYEDACDAYAIAYPTARSRKYMAERVDELLGTDLVQREIVDELVEIGRSIGVTKEWIMAKFKDEVVTAETSNERQRALENLSKHLGMTERGNSKIKKTISREGSFEGFDPERLEELGFKGGKVKATVSVETTE